jgi:hypothetical protein
MRNITVKISDDTDRDARAWSVRRNTSASAVMQYLLQTRPNLRVPRVFPEANQPLDSTHSAPVNPPVPWKSKSLHAFFAPSNCAEKNNPRIIKNLPRKSA